MKTYLLHAFYLVLIVVCIFGFQYPPFQDLPVLSYQGYLFNQYFFHGNTFGGYWHLYGYLPPNAVSTIVLGLMDIVLDPIFAGKIYILLLAALLYSGIIRYLRFHTRSNRLAFSSIAFFLTISLHFFMGF